MVRQCAWCLCLIDCSGERLSSPLPKLYEASHGICSVCGTMWIARAIENHTGQGPTGQPEYKEPRLVSQKEQPVSQTAAAPTLYHPTDS
jgi:hypothetical protein